MGVEGYSVVKLDKNSETPLKIIEKKSVIISKPSDFRTNDKNRLN